MHSNPILLSFMVAANMISTLKKRNITYLKAFAIIMVVFYHAVCDILCASNPNDMFAAGTKSVMENVHVPLFFLIAGYLCHKQNVRNFYKKKIQRILIPFLFMSCLKLFFNNFISSAHIHGEGIGYQLFDAFVCGKLYWFCYALLIMYAAAPLLWNRKLRIWIVLVGSLAANVLMNVYNIKLTDVLQLENAIYQLPFFATGMLLAQYNVFRKSVSIASRTLSSLAAIITAAAMIYTELILGIDNYIISFIMGLSIMYILYLIAACFSGVAADRIFALPSEYSFQIMLLDSFYRVLLILVMSKFMNPDIWMVIMVSILVLLLSCATCRLLVKIPVIRVFMGLKNSIS